MTDGDAPKTPQPEMPDLDAELEARLAAFEAKARARREVHETEKAAARAEQAADAESVRGVGVGLSLAYTILGLPLAGFGVGWLLENAGIRGWTPILVLVFCIVALVLAAWKSVKYVNQR
jgi:F0F1-type ATP synthase assembly protein I